MDRNKLLIYSAILLIGFFISFYAIRGYFSPRDVGILVFFLVFIPALVNPDIGLIIIIFSMLFSPEIIIGESTHREVTIRIEDVFLIVIILAWAIRIAFTKDIASAFKTKLTAPFFVFVTACVLSTLFSLIFGEGEVGAKYGFFSALKYLEYFLLFFMVRDNIRNLGQTKILVGAMLVVALLTSLHTNVVIEREIQAGTTFFRTAPPVETRGGGEAGTLGGYYILMMGIAGGILLYTRYTPLRACLILLELLMFRGLLYTLSRGSYLALVPLVIALIFFTQKSKVLPMFIVTSVGLLTLLFMPEMIKERILTTVTIRTDKTFPETPYYLQFDESPTMRLESWADAIVERFPRSPLFGYGTGRHFIDGQVFYILANTGLFGLLSLLWILTRTWRLLKEIMDKEIVKKDNYAAGLSVGLMAAYVGLLFHSIGTNTFTIIAIMEPFWFTAAIVLSLPQLLKKEEVGSNQ